MLLLYIFFIEFCSFHATTTPISGIQQRHYHQPNKANSYAQSIQNFVCMSCGEILIMYIVQSYCFIVPHSHILVVLWLRRSPISFRTQIHNKLLILHTLAVVWERRNLHVLNCVRCIIASEFRVSLNIKPTVVFVQSSYPHVPRKSSNTL